MLSFLLFFTFSTRAQIIDEPFTIYVIGQVVDSETGSPVSDQEVYCESYEEYNPGFVFEDSYNTDDEGFFYDTIGTFQDKGSFYFSTYDYLNNKSDTISYFRFKDRDKFYVFVNFSIQTEVVVVDYQAQFSFMKDTTNLNPLLVHFFDKSMTNNILTWDWDFGDGNYSNIQHPNHVYGAPGLYRVELTITGLYSSEEVFYESSFVKMVFVDFRYNYILSGQAFFHSPPFLIDQGIALLYEKLQDDFYPVDTFYINNEYANFYFPQLPEGDYIVKAGLTENSEEYGNYTSTYFGNTIYWQLADIVQHHNNNYDCDINLSYNVYTGTGNGPGEIAGSVDTDTACRSVPSVGTEMILMSSNSQPVCCCLTDEEGKFILSSLDLQEYILYIDEPGKESQPIFLTLTEENPTISSVYIIIGPETVYSVLGIEEDLLKEQITFGPNPVIDYLQLNFNLVESTDLSVTIYNQSGQQIDKFLLGEEMMNHSFRIDFSTLSSGNYYLHIDTGKESTLLPIIH